MARLAVIAARAATLGRNMRAVERRPSRQRLREGTRLDQMKTIAAGRLHIPQGAILRTFYAIRQHPPHRGLLPQTSTFSAVAPVL